MHPADTPADRGLATPDGAIHLRIPELRQLFNPMDPSAVGRKDLHPDVEEFIVSWGREIPGRSPLELVIHVDAPVRAAAIDEAAGAVHGFFEQRARVARRELRQLFRVGRISLGIALGVLALTVLGGELIAGSGTSALRSAVGGTLEIGGWVAMWRPLQIFLYDWWPITADIRLLHRLAVMPIRVAAPADVTG